jgi:hypothetical protein
VHVQPRLRAALAPLRKVAYPLQVEEGRVMAPGLANSALPIANATAAAAAARSPDRPSLFQSFATFFHDEIARLFEARDLSDVRTQLRRLTPRYIHFRLALLELMAGEALAAEQDGRPLGDRSPQELLRELVDNDELLGRAFGAWAPKLQVLVRMSLREDRYFAELLRNGRLMGQTRETTFKASSGVDLLVSLSLIAAEEGRVLADSAREALVLTLEKELRRWSMLLYSFHEQDRAERTFAPTPEPSDDDQALADAGLTEWARQLDGDTD